MARRKISKNIYFDTIKKLYYVKFYYGKNGQGKYITKYKTVKTKKEAEKQLTEFLHGKNANTIILPSEHTVKTWLEYWIKEIVEPNLEKTTAYGYKQIIENHINPALGNVSMQKLSADQVQRYYADELNKLSANTVLKHHALLKTAFDLAIKQDIISKSPIDRVQKPKRTFTEKTPYNAEQLGELISQALCTRLEVVVVLAAYLGLRREEILGLTWDDVNLDNCTINIRRARTSAGNEIISKAPKTHSSNRLMYLPDRAWETLYNAEQKNSKKRMEHGDKYNAENLVVISEQGTPYRPNYISELFSKFVNDNGFTKLTLHGLRHTFASLANEQGHTLFDIGKLLGHSRPDTTGKIYTHMFEKANEELVNSVSDKIENNMSTLPTVASTLKKFRKENDNGNS